MTTVTEVEAALASLAAELDQEHLLDPRGFWSTVAGEDSFRHLAGGIGDFNPLWWDTAYAVSGPRRGPTAPPVWLATVAMPYQHLLGLRPAGWSSLDGDVRWEYFEHVRPGDVLSATARLVEVERKNSRRLGEALLVRGSADYRDQRRRLLARSTAGLWFFPARAAAGGGRVRDGGEPEASAPLAGQVPSAGQVAPAGQVLSGGQVPSAGQVPFDALGRLTRRGAEPRYGEHVEVGEEVTVLQRPTLSTFELLAWCVGSGMSGFEPIARGERADLRGLPNELIEQRSVMRHLLPDLSRREGLSGGFDIGTQRSAWIGQLVTDWMGDHGELVELYCRFGRLLHVGDTPRCGGRVEESRREGGRWRVGLALWVRNQRGETVSEASAVVSLPSLAA
ncbi:FAS1-like dehydratase domain-containing protein [Streptomyces chartreusis]|uniref:FAS1-like dehydratase domain-containing protein n=1 Tax=Streptomyces chartreusis TaxID=1969 RepID=UPI003633DE11